MTALSKSFYSYLFSLEEKYQKTIENRWVWIVVGLVVLAAIGWYAWYCTSRGRSFAFNVKFNWPRSGQMGVACN
ncbi:MULTISPECIES: hypothetical protein [unclassified Streptococcus]|uniref:hypothetical protein n=1 Tax=unclassified Streptococcus TaxID=2608887 RepID=UPI00359EB0C3